MDHKSSHSIVSNLEAGKFNIDSAELIDRGAPLPETYGDNRLVLMVRDPSWIFSYWEITPGRIQSIQDQFGEDVFYRSRKVIRVYDIRPDSTPGAFFDVDVQFEKMKTYVHIENSARHHFAELGLILPDGHFIPLMKSNPVHMPLGHVSDRVDTQFMAVDVKEFEWKKIMEASGSEKVGKGSSEASRIMAQRWEFLRSVFSGTSMWLSSSGRPWSGLFPSSKQSTKV